MAISVNPTSVKTFDRRKRSIIIKNNDNTTKNSIMANSKNDTSGRDLVCLVEPGLAISTSKNHGVRIVNAMGKNLSHSHSLHIFIKNFIIFPHFLRI